MDADSQTELGWIRKLYRLAQQTALGGDVRDTWRQLIRHILEYFSADSGSLADISSDGDGLIIVATQGLPQEVLGKKIVMGSGIFGTVADKEEPLLLNGVLADDARLSGDEARRGSHVPHSAMCWPLMIDNQLTGVISINRGREQPPFTEADLENGVTAIDFIAAAVENVRLHAQSEAQLKQLEYVQSQLLQSEKMAAIGQLAAGVAHEINNPIGYIQSNLATLKKYCNDLFRLLHLYERFDPSLDTAAELKQQIEDFRRAVDIGYLEEDLQDLLRESQQGIDRVCGIVQDLKDFSHVDEGEWEWADLHQGLDSTLNIVNNELKYTAEVVKEYAMLPQIECRMAQLNQVFMNLLVNAVHAIEARGVITIRTGQDDEDEVWVEISDNGKGIAPENLSKLFNPFFTTKPVGQGTGLGLSLSYSIVEKHHGRIEVESELGKGTSFRIWLPVRQDQAQLARIAHQDDAPSLDA